MFIRRNSVEFASLLGLHITLISLLMCAVFMQSNALFIHTLSS